MAERELVELDAHEARPLGGGERRDLASRPLQQREITDLGGGRQSEQAARGVRQRIDAPRERVLDARLHRERMLVRQLRRGELDQRERVAERRRERPVGGTGRQRPRRVVLEHGGGGLAIEPSEHERRQALGEPVAGPRGDQQRERVREHAAGGEQDRAEA